VRVHNDYLDLLAEYGLAGMAGFLLFLAAHLRNGLHTFFWLVRKRLQFSADWRSSSLALNIGCLCAVAAYMVHSVVDFNLHIPANAMLMAFVFGMLANPGLETSHEKKAEVKTNRAFQFVLPALGLVILAAGLPKLPGEWYAEKARVALRDKQYLDAKLAAEEGIEWEKKNPDLYYYLGESERNVGDLFPVPALAGPFYQAASDAFKKGLELFPEDENLLLIEGWTLDVMGRHEEAGGYFQQAVDWDPNSEVVRQYEASHMDYLKAAEQPPPAS
jgi:tetratricopeptide (TPR) repeat protein